MCVAGDCIEPAAPGDACTEDELCSSGACVDEVCYAEPCASPCERCQAGDGACVPRGAGPTDGCDDAYDSAGTCLAGQGLFGLAPGDASNQFGWLSPDVGISVRLLQIDLAAAALPALGVRGAPRMHLDAPHGTG